VALQARMMSQALRKLTGLASESGTTIIFINQLRDKVGVFFGSAETQPGGKALKFYASVRLDVRRISTIKDGEQPIGSRVKVKVVKNKLGRPFNVAEFDFLFGVGISRSGELLDLGAERGVLKKSGVFYVWDGKNIGQGKVKARQFLDANPEAFAAVEKAVRAAETVPAAPKARSRGLVGEGPAPWDGEEDSSSDT
jgi:recombination protein RecA